MFEKERTCVAVRQYSYAVAAERVDPGAFPFFPFLRRGAGDADGTAVFQLRLEGETRHLAVFEDDGHADVLIGCGFYF